jgi:arabinofuranosyltransferase
MLRRGMSAESGVLVPAERAPRTATWWQTARPAPHARQALLVAALAFGYALLVYRTAWMSDDAFISARTAYNVLHGYGLRWNVEERVQTFTHPLWMMALIGAHALTREAFYSTLYLSLIVSSLAMGYFALRLPGCLTVKAFAIALLCMSKAFVEYSSSGLENPLTHLLLVAFAVQYFRARRASFGALALIAGLSAANRLDTALLYLPALAATFPRERPWRGVRALALAASPLLLWESFSLVYYGFPWPNTAYAKLGIGDLAGSDRWLEALNYFRSSLEQDPITLVAICACAVAAVVRADRARLPLLAGAALYLAYVASIGGDFMSGRFFSAPLLIAIACLATSDWLQPRATFELALAGAVVVVLLGDPPPAFTPRDFGVRSTKQALNRFGIHDARAEFFLIDSLAHAAEMRPELPDHPWTILARRYKRAAERDASQRVQVIDAIGHAGYYAGPKVHVVDGWALGDPLLARLPAVFGAIGHYTRALPDGYLETLRDDANHIADPNLARYYAALARITRGPLWSTQRWRDILRMNTGGYDALRDAYAYVRGPVFEPRLHIVNPGDQREMAVYVWNDQRLSSFLIDTDSKRGKRYDVAWRITPRGAEVTTPGALRLSGFEHLRDAGVFTLSVAFRTQALRETADIYELRFFYRVRNGELLILRQPWPTYSEGFPYARWRDAPVGGVVALQPDHAPRAVVSPP